MSSANIFKQYFRTNRALLKLSALWFSENKKLNKQKLFELFYNTLWSVYLYFIYFPTECLYLYYVYNDFDQFIRCLRDLGNHIALIYKAITYYLHRKEIVELIETLENHPYQFEEFGDFQPKLIVEQHRQQAIKWSNIFWYFVNGICACMFFSGLIIFVFAKDGQFVVGNDGRRVYQQRLPVNVVSPFGNETRVQFFVTFLYEIVALTFYGWMIISLDSLFISLVNCVTANLIILKGAFKTIRPRCLKKLNLPIEDTLHDSIEVQNEMQKEMTKCIKYLQLLFDVSAKLEHIFNVQTCFQTLISLGEMCFCLYLLSDKLDENTGNELTYLASTGFELLLYCWFGNQITEASFQVSYSLYDSDWLSTNTAFKKQLLFTLTRMNKPIYITIGKVTPLTFATFLTMVRGAYSFFTFLKQRDGIRSK